MITTRIILVTSIFCTFYYLHSGNTPSKIPQKQEHQIVVAPPKRDSTKTEDKDNNNNNGNTVVNLNIAPNISPVISGTASSNAASSSQSAAYVYFSNKITNIVKTIQNLNAADISHSMQQCLCAYKWHLLVAVPTITYINICAFLLYVNMLMNNQTNWLQWKYHLTIEELGACYQEEKEKKEMMHQLVRSIFKQHINTAQPTNHISPLVHFITAIDRELKFITHYIRLAQMLKLSRLITIFPTNEEKIAKAKLAKQRLEFIKKLFVDWTATHNLEQFLHPPTPPTIPEQIVINTAA